MRAFLLDANVLIALAWPDHVAHERVGAWFASHSRAGWATCPFTEAAFVRILSNPAFSPKALSPTNALIVLKRNVELPNHRFWGDAIPLGEAVARLSQRLTGHQQVTDAYLIGLATHNGGKLATLDAKLVHLGPAVAIEMIT
ncbi:MAG: TA system VapC family ribonuclease toxin [Terriglobales bacterium]